MLRYQSYHVQHERFLGQFWMDPEDTIFGTIHFLNLLTHPIFHRIFHTLISYWILPSGPSE